MMPGLTAMPFWTLSGIFVFVALKNYNAAPRQKLTDDWRRGAQVTAHKPDDPVENYLFAGYHGLEIGYSLIPMIETEQGAICWNDLLLRIQLFDRTRIIFPPSVSATNCSWMINYFYSIKMSGIIRARWLMTGYHMVLLPATSPEIQGIQTKDPTFGNGRTCGLAAR